MHMVQTSICPRIPHIRRECPVKISEYLSNYTPYTILQREMVTHEPRRDQKIDSSGKKGHSIHQKILAALTGPGTGASFRDLDNKARMSSESLRSYLNIFMNAIISRFGGGV